MRPNRYPYTKNQWEEETTLVFFGNEDYLKMRNERNRITKESRQCHYPDSMVMEAGVIDTREILRGH